MLLADAPKFLNGVIQDSDTPFIYEKVGLLLSALPHRRISGYLGIAVEEFLSIACQWHLIRDTEVLWWVM